MGVGDIVTGDGEQVDHLSRGVTIHLIDYECVVCNIVHNPQPLGLADPEHGLADLAFANTLYATQFTRRTMLVQRISFGR